MKRKWNLLIVLATFFIVVSSSMVYGDSDLGKAPAGSVVAKFGQLQVTQGKLCDQKGNPVQLKGMSTMGLQWFPYTGETVKNLVKDWHITVFRAAMYTREGGFIDDPSVMSKLQVLVEESIRQGIYVIIDWHVLSEGDPNLYKEDAKIFFEDMAKLYGSYPNVIYELCNEPNGPSITWKDKIKPYAEYVIPGIRAVDPDNIIIVGTDNYSQGVRAAAVKPLAYNNMMYALHFYAGTHGQFLRDVAKSALAKGAALFVTEWGTTPSSGSGELALEEAQKWLDWMDANMISWVNWSLCNKAEDSAALTPGGTVTGPWTEEQISPSGKWVRDKIMGK